MTARSLRIAHLTPGMGVHHGGPAKSVSGLAQAQYQAGHTVAIFAMEDRLGRPAVQVADLDIRLTPSSGLTRLQYSAGLISQVLDYRPDIIHSHGIWTYFSWASHVVARRLAIPHISAPRGMLDEWALHSGSLQKRIAGALYQDRILRRAACLHALVPEETVSLLAYGLCRPIAAVPNGVHERLLTLARDRTGFDRRFPDLNGKRIVLFLGRIDPKKGLLFLIEAWGSLGAARKGWHLAIAGPLEGDHVHDVRAMIGGRGLDNAVSLLGPQVGDQVHECLLAADIFALPSFSEGFSMSVLEAIACGTPVCITPACNFPAVEAVQAGSICSPTSESIAQSLGSLMARTPSERAAMGERGRELVRNGYTWEPVRQRMDDVYGWLLDQSGRVPDCVTLP